MSDPDALVELKELLETALDAERDAAVLVTVTRLRAALAALHQPVDPDGLEPFCGGCGAELVLVPDAPLSTYAPCPTMAAFDQAAVAGLAEKD